MRVIFDHQIFTLQRYGGISRYICALATELTKYSNTWTRIVAPLHINGHLTAIHPSLRFGRHIEHPLTTRGLTAFNSAVFPLISGAFHPDIIHETYFSGSPSPLSRSKRVLTVYDMIHEKFPQDFPASDATRSHKASAVERADHIICISENTRKDLLDILNPHESKVSVVHLACDVLPTEDAAVPDLVSAGPFLLFVGNRNRYKNFSALLDVIASSLQLRAQIRIICFGGGPINGHERTSLLKHGLSEHSIVFTDGDDAQLATLYRRALALVCTSTYEGFGIPVLEAMSQGCPVICARTSSLPEVAGSAAEYFDPFDNDSLRQAIGKVVESNARRRELAQAGRVRSQQFSWQKCASETHRIYESLV